MAAPRRLPRYTVGRRARLLALALLLLAVLSLLLVRLLLLLLLLLLLACGGQGAHDGQHDVILVLRLVVRKICECTRASRESNSELNAQAEGRAQGNCCQPQAPCVLGVGGLRLGYSHAKQATCSRLTHMHADKEYME